MQQKVILPFNLNTPIRSYLYSAFPCGIVTQSGSLRGPLLHHHLQIFFPFSKLSTSDRMAHVRFLPGMALHDFAALGYLRLLEWTYTETVGLALSELFRLMADALEKGHYLHAYVDRYHIPGTMHFLRKHSRYSTLIVGFDFERQALINVGYKEGGEFTHSYIPVELLSQALRLEECGLIRAKSNVAVHEILPSGLASVHVDSKLVISQIRDYLSGARNVGSYFSDGCFSVPNSTGVALVDSTGACGIEALRYFKEYVTTSIADKLPIDLRATRILMEHADIIAATIPHIVSGGCRGSASQDWDQIRILAKTLHLLSFAWNKEGSMKSSTRLTELIDQITNAQKLVLGRVLDNRE